MPAEIVILAIGVRPEIGLAKAAGLEIGSRNGIRVDEFNRTSNPDIYAVGDAAEKIDALDGNATICSSSERTWAALLVAMVSTCNDLLQGFLLEPLQYVDRSLTT